MDTDHCIAWFGNVQMILSVQPPSAEFMVKIISELEALSKKLTMGTGALLVIRSDVAPPSDAARQYIERELKKSSMRAAAQVVEGTGFRGAAMRSVLTMLQLAARPPYPMKVFGQIEPAAMWLTDELKKRVGDSPAGADLVDAVMNMRGRLLEQARTP